MRYKKALLIWTCIVLLAYWFHTWATAEPSKMSRDCIASHIETLTVMTYNVSLKMSMPTTQARTICDAYSDWYISPKWQRWSDKQEATQ
jgi:hypothetical protein